MDGRHRTVAANTMPNAKMIRIMNLLVVTMNSKVCTVGHNAMFFRKSQGH